MIANTRASPQGSELLEEVSQVGVKTSGQDEEREASHLKPYTQRLLTILDILIMVGSTEDENAAG